MEIRRHGVHRGDFGSRVPNQAVTRSVHEHTVRLPVPDSGTNSETLVEPGGQTNLLSEHIRGGWSVNAHQVAIRVGLIEDLEYGEAR